MKRPEKYTAEQLKSFLDENGHRKTEGKQQSSWVLAIRGPLNSKHLRVVEEAAERSILNDDPSYFTDISEKQAILERKANETKTINVISVLSGFSKIPGSELPTANVQAQIDYAIERILKDKACILKALTNYDKRVLLIESQYFFARQDNVTDTIRKYYDLRDGIDFIYLVTPKPVDMIG